MFLIHSFIQYLASHHHSHHHTPWITFKPPAFPLIAHRITYRTKQAYISTPWILFRHKEQEHSAWYSNVIIFSPRYAIFNFTTTLIQRSNWIVRSFYFTYILSFMELIKCFWSKGIHNCWIFAITQTSCPRFFFKRHFKYLIRSWESWNLHIFYVSWQCIDWFKS